MNRLFDDMLRGSPVGGSGGQGGAMLARHMDVSETGPALVAIVGQVMVSAWILAEWVGDAGQGCRRSGGR